MRRKKSKKSKKITKEKGSDAKRKRRRERSRAAKSLVRGKTRKDQGRDYRLGRKNKEKMAVVVVVAKECKGKVVLSMGKRIQERGVGYLYASACIHACTPNWRGGGHGRIDGWV